ncbi:MAG TPA: alpha/beta hydrolase [Flavobacterium sp.]|nr:alpha/beta hydrolase [Flavobacterium sp.]
MKNIFLLLFLTVGFNAFSQEKKITEAEIAINPLIKGTLFSPENPTNKTKVVIMIAGSGPTNRSGNQIGMQTNCSRYLAQSLAKNDIAAFSYDKRIFAQMIAGTLDEKKLSFEDFINDAKDVIAYFKNQKQYAKIIVLGHSEGSLIGMVAANNNNADGFISIAGPARPIDEVLTEQLMKMMPSHTEEIKHDLELLKKGETFELKSSNPTIVSVFRESVQPYMISWLKYNPQDEIRKLKIPVLLINGTKDLQVPSSDAELLKKAKPEAKLEIITNMNHVLKEVKGDDAENKATYNNPDLPIMNELTIIVNQFIKSI